MLFSYETFEDEKPEVINDKRLALLKKQISFTRENSPYYQRLFKRIGLDFREVKSYEDFSRLPVTTKDDLRRQNHDFIAVPPQEQVDMLTTSGTTGNPVFMPATPQDIRRIAVYGAQSLALSGLSNTDIVHLTLPMSAWMWMAGFGYYLCFSCLGATVLRFGPGFTEKSIDTLVKLNATALTAVPSFALKLGQIIRERGIAHNVRRIITVAENVMEKDLSHNAMGKRIEELWGAELISCYGATEGTFMAVECDRHQGHHINPYEVYIEILDPKSFKPVPPGKPGLVTITPLGARALPLLRYVTGDISFMPPGRCPCQRMLDRIGPILSRNDHMVKVKGVLVYPEAVKKVLSGYDGIEIFQLEVIKEGFVTTIRVLIPDPGNPEIIEEIRRDIRSHLGVSLPVIPLPFDELKNRVFPPEVRKPVVFIDKRNKSDAGTD